LPFIVLVVEAESFGDHHIYGLETIHFYTRMKAVTSRWPTGIKSGAVYNFPTLN